MWTTEDEMDYLKGIGAHGETSKRPSKQRRIELLKSYIAAAKLRVDWGEMDKSRVVSYAHQRLFALQIEVG